MEYFRITKPEELKKVLDNPEFGNNKEWDSRWVYAYLIKAKDLKWERELVGKTNWFVCNDIQGYVIRVSERRVEINGKKLIIERGYRLRGYKDIETNYHDFGGNEDPIYKEYRSGQDKWTSEDRDQLYRFDCAYENAVNTLDDVHFYSAFKSLYDMIQIESTPNTVCRGKVRSFVRKFLEEVEWKVVDIELLGNYNRLELEGEFRGSPVKMRLYSSDGCICVNNDTLDYPCFELYDKIINKLKDIRINF